MDRNSDGIEIPNFLRHASGENSELRSSSKHTSDSEYRAKKKTVSSLYGAGFDEEVQRPQKKTTAGSRTDIISDIARKREERSSTASSTTHLKKLEPEKKWENPLTSNKQPELKKTVSFRRAASADESEPRREASRYSSYSSSPSTSSQSSRSSSTVSKNYESDDDYVPTFTSRRTIMGQEEPQVPAQTAQPQKHKKTKRRPVQKTRQPRTQYQTRQPKEPRQPKPKGPKKKIPVGRYIGRFGACLGTFLLVVVFFLVGVLIIVNRGPSVAFRDQFVMTVSESSAGSFLSTWFLSDEVVQQIRDENAIVTDDTISTGDDVVITTPAPDQEPLELVDVAGKTFNGKMLIVADPGRVFIGTPPNGYGSSKEGMKTIDMAKHYNAIAAINGGGFYDTGKGNGGVPTGRQNSSGIVIHEGKMLWGSNSTTYELIGIDKDKKLVLGKMTGAEAMNRGIQEALNFGPYLILDGEPQSIGSAMTEGGLNPRSAIGQRKDGAMLLLVINGRQPNSLGASYDDLISVMLDFGAVNAANLDGGSSSYMVYENEIITTCASLYGPRKMATSILVKR